MPNDLTSHYQILVRTGSISLISGIIGGSISYFISRDKTIKTRKGQIALYVSKIGTGFFAAYLAVLSMGVFGLQSSPEMEQAISILAAILGSDFIALLSRRIFGQGINWRNNDREERDYRHQKDCDDKDKELVEKNKGYQNWLE